MEVSYTLADFLSLKKVINRIQPIKSMAMDCSSPGLPGCLSVRTGAWHCMIHRECTMHSVA